MRSVLLSKRDAYLRGQSLRHTKVMELIQSLVASLKTSMVLPCDLVASDKEASEPQA